jgi:hypothetical protein
VPVHPVHPDPEELAAWQAGDLPEPSGARVEAHVAGCVDCAATIAAVERGRVALAGLAEVEPPAGLHERLTAALQLQAGGPAAGDGASGGYRPAGDPLAERRSAAANGGERSGPIAEPISLDGRRRRSSAGRRLVTVLSAAAGVILLVVGLVPLLQHLGGGRANQSAGGGVAALGDAEAGSLPVFSAPDGYSGSALRSALTSDAEIRSAYQRAVQARNAEPSARPNQAAPEADSQSGSGFAANRAPTAGADGEARSTTGSQGAPGLQQALCVASARNQAGDQGLRPAFFVDTVYHGRTATVLVTVRPGAPGQADLWAFPRGDCSAAPFAHERVTVSPP